MWLGPAWPLGKRKRGATCFSTDPELFTSTISSNHQHSEGSSRPPFKMPTLGLNNFNIVCSTLGGFIALFGLISFLAKDRFFLSEARRLINHQTRISSHLISELKSHN